MTLVLGQGRFCVDAMGCRSRGTVNCAQNNVKATRRVAFTTDKIPVAISYLKPYDNDANHTPVGDAAQIVSKPVFGVLQLPLISLALKLLIHLIDHSYP